MHKQSTHGAKTPFFERFQNWAAMIGAVLATFFLHPFAFDSSQGFVTAFGEEHYGIGWAIPGMWWLLTFGGLVAGFSLIIRVIATGGIVSLMRRFF
ncbi:hypothetical protein [Hyphobacterium sp.]|uniref:hypothetical protein n=1 Tax=Hyphobacterium sp. TaxID=2004662 RepID=UPI00374A1083